MSLGACYEPDLSQDFMYPVGRAADTICRAQCKMKMLSSLIKNQEKSAINGTYKEFPFFYVLSQFLWYFCLLFNVNKYK